MSEPMPHNNTSADLPDRFPEGQDPSRDPSGRRHPKVSICIPTYNHAEQVRRLLVSISEQTFRDYEVILSDDSTTDEIARLVREARAGREEGILPFPGGGEECTRAAARPAEEAEGTGGLPTLRYVHNEAPLGHIYNWNRAMDLAQGEMIKIMFSDDWFTFPDSLERMVSLLEEDPEADLAFCGSRQTPLPGPDGTPPAKEAWDRCARPEFIGELKKDYRYLFMGDEIGAPSATIFRSCGVRFVEDSSWASDMFLYFEILTRNPQFAFTPDPLVCIGIHGDQYTDSFAERDIRKYQDDRGMYERYDIGRSEACRRRMLHQNVVYRQGWQTAKDCGASMPEYLRERISWFWTNTVLGYWGGLKNKVKKMISRG